MAKAKKNGDIHIWRPDLIVNGYLRGRITIAADPARGINGWAKANNDILVSSGSTPHYSGSDASANLWGYLCENMGDIPPSANPAPLLLVEDQFVGKGHKGPIALVAARQTWVCYGFAEGWNTALVSNQTWKTILGLTAGELKSPPLLKKAVIDRAQALIDRAGNTPYQLSSIDEATALVMLEWSLQR